MVMRRDPRVPDTITQNFLSRENIARSVFMADTLPKRPT